MAETEATKFRKYFKTERTIDGELVLLDIAKMDIDEWLAFRTSFRHMKDRADRSTREKAAAKTQDEYEAVLEQEKKNDVSATEFMRDSITEYVRVREGCELLDEDDQPVVTGAELFEYYGRNLSAISELATAIWLEHSLTKSQKKALRLQRASASGSAATAAPTGNGLKPEPTAANAEPSTTAASAGVTARRSGSRSSTTTT